MYFPKVATICLAMAAATGISTISLADDPPEMGGPNSDTNLAELLSNGLLPNLADEEEAQEVAGDLIEAINLAEKNYGQGEKTLIVKMLLQLAESGEIEDAGVEGFADDYGIALDNLLGFRAEGRGWGEILKTEYGITPGDVMRSDKAKENAQNTNHGGAPEPTLQQHSGGKPEVSPASNRPDRPLRPEKAEKPVRPERPDRPSRP